MERERVIVVQHLMHPMNFRKGQFTYVYPKFDQPGRQQKLKTYTREQAEKLIERSTRYRVKKGFGVPKYHIIPIAL